jgi:hypothetical protein
VAEVGRTVQNTIAKTPITFAMIETAVSADCNARKSQWMRYGFKDVTPVFGSRSAVPSINDSAVSQGREMLKKLATVSADWYMISGHHGAIYSTEYDRFTTDGQPPAEDNSNFPRERVAKLYNEEEYCGFFNEAYHETYWVKVTRSNPDLPSNLSASDSAKAAKEVYLRTTDAAPDSMAKFSQDNPVFASTSAPKGIILSACNTLIYKSARKKWSGYFPNAVIIGPFSRIVSGTWVSNAVANAAMTNENFWRDPQSILDQPGMCEQLEQQLTAAFPSSGQIAVIYKQKIYLKTGAYAVDFDM